MAEAESDRRGTAGGWTAVDEQRSLADRQFALVVGLVSGLLGGMGAFMYKQAPLVPKLLPFLSREGWAVAVAALGGAFAFLLARTTRESVVGMLVGSVVALVVLFGTQVFPAYAVSTSAVGRGYVVQGRLGMAVPTVFGVLVLVYWGGYLATLSVVGVLDP